MGIGFAAVVLLVAVAVLILTRTDFGVRDVGGYLVRTVNGRINGRLDVGRVTSPGGLLNGLTLHDVRIRDTGGGQILEADSISLSYDWRTIVAGRIVLDRLWLFRPHVVLQQLPGDSLWNFERLLAPPPGAKPGSGGPAPLVVIGGIRLVDADVVVRIPWDSKGGAPDTTRFEVTRVAGGLERVMRFRHVHASIPRLLLSSPLEHGQLFQIDTLATTAEIWKQPAQLRQAHGTFALRDSVLSFHFDPVVLPDTRAVVFGRIIVTAPEPLLDIQIDADTVAFADLKWLSPDLPTTGGGRVHLRIESVPGGVLYSARDLSLRAPNTRVLGDVGLVVGDSAYFTHVDLQAGPLDVGLFQHLIPGNIPFKGLQVGRLQLRAPGH